LQDRKLLWKLDLQLIPWLTLLYLIAFLDRTNIGNAKIDGLQEDLNMTSNQYNNTLTIFFISYSVFEPLTQVLLKKFKPSIFIPAIMLGWGICMTWCVYFDSLTVSMLIPVLIAWVWCIITPDSWRPDGSWV
jgi:sugar phosphate permease